MPSLSTPEFLQLQAVVAGRYSIEHELGRGGMGVVFLARDVRLDRAVAIKLLAPHLAARADMRRRFLREARIAAQCFHPHIVPIHAVEEIDDIAFFVMSYVRGETLAQRIARVGALPPDVVLRVGREVGWALAYAHERGVVHRDIKPENILLEQGTDRCLLTDFGIALLDDPERTPQSGEVAGTSNYMAPEQALGESIDGRADLYALGVTLFVAATGQQPFSAPSPMAMLVQHALHPAPAIGTLAPHLPQSLGDAIDRCMSKRADDRFATAAEFIDALSADNDAPLMPRAVLSVHASARATVTLLGWAAAVAASTALFMIGETGFGRGIMQYIGFGAAEVLAATALIRAGETLYQSRRSLALGTPVDDVVRAIAGTEESVARTTGSRASAAMKLLTGAGIAVAEGFITRYLEIDTEIIASLLQVTLLILPPVLIARGAVEMLTQGGGTRWLQRKIMTPIGRGVTRLFGARSRGSSDTAMALNGAATEVVLDHAAIELFQELTPSLREELSALPETINVLARDAESLRNAERQVLEADRAARASGLASDHPQRVHIAAQRDRIRSRLATTIAALETIRLDLMRLAAGTVDSAGLTTHLGVIRQLEQRVAADDEMRALLQRPLNAGVIT